MNTDANPILLHGQIQITSLEDLNYFAVKCYKSILFATHVHVFITSSAFTTIHHSLLDEGLSNTPSHVFTYFPNFIHPTFHPLF